MKLFIASYAEHLLRFFIQQQNLVILQPEFEDPDERIVEKIHVFIANPFYPIVIQGAVGGIPGKLTFSLKAVSGIT